MATDLIEINPLEPSPDALDRAASLIRSGRVVAVPTDALYTLVADPFSLRAVRQVYAAKGRPINRALPLLVRDALMVGEPACDITPLSHPCARLARRSSACNRQHRAACGSSGKVHRGGSAHRAPQSAPHRNQCEYFRLAHLSHWY